MTSRQKILAERLINDVMYNGISELLTSQSSLKLHSQYSDPIDGNHSISNEVNNPLQLTPQYALNYVPIKYEYESREGEEWYNRWFWTDLSSYAMEVVFIVRHTFINFLFLVFEKDV